MNTTAGNNEKRQRRPNTAGSRLRTERDSQPPFGDADSRVRAILNSVVDGIITIGSDGTIVAFNPAAERIFGYGPAEVIGRNVSMLMPSPDRDKHDGYVRQYLATGKANIIGRPREVEGLRKDGTRFPMNLAVTETPVGDRLFFTGVVRDVSRLRRTEQALLEAQKYESLGVLAGGIAHDFNNLLTTVIGNADLAMNVLPADSPARSILEDIKLAARRAAELANQLLVYAGKSEAVIRETDLTTLVEELAPLLRASVSNGVELELDCSSGLPAVRADEVQVRQVVMNLVINASDAIGDRAGTITVSTGSMHADEAYLRLCHLAPGTRAGEYAYIEVADDGPGMGDEALARIFDPFYTTKFTGRGLGLAVVLGVVRSHNGAIGIQSAPGVGSSFRFLLPAMQAPNEEEGRT